MDEIYRNYCIKEVSLWILKNKFTKVGLEFSFSTEYYLTISKSLKELIGFTPYILHDPNRACGNCCADVRTARPRGIECIVHFGSSCLSPTHPFPVLYVLSSPIDSDPALVLESLQSEEGPAKDDPLILAYDIRCTPSIDKVYNKISKYFPKMVLSRFILSESAELIFPGSSLSDDFASKLRIESSDTTKISLHNRSFQLQRGKKNDDYNFVYLGPSGPSLFSLQMKFAGKIFYQVPLTGRSTTLCVTDFVRTVMSRSAKIEQVRRAKTIGIINSLPHGHETICLKLRNLARAAERRCYSFYMGKINEAKLANIVGVDVFVYVGCPESSLFDRIEDKYLYRNIVTPWEAEIALNPKTEWNLDFELDFRKLMQDQSFSHNFIPIDKDQVATSEGDADDRVKENSSELCLRREGTLAPLHQNAAGEALANLSWKGLDPAEQSSVPVGTIVKGKKGIAIEYEKEGE